MHKLFLVCSLLVSLLALSACGGNKAAPSVVGERLDVAESDVKDAGLDYEEIGGGTFGIVVKSNWTVCEQEPAAGTKTDKVKLIVDRVCDSDTSSSDSTSSDSTSNTTETEPETAASGSTPDLARGRLEGAQYKVSTADVGTGHPTPQAALQVRQGKMNVTIYFYTDSTDASASARRFDPLKRSKPNQIAIRTVGSNVYVGTIEEPAALPTQKFQQIVHTAEGS